MTNALKKSFGSKSKSSNIVEQKISQPQSISNFSTIDTNAFMKKLEDQLIKVTNN